MEKPLTLPLVPRQGLGSKTLLDLELELDHLDATLGPLQAKRAALAAEIQRRRAGGGADTGVAEMALADIVAQLAKDLEGRDEFKTDTVADRCEAVLRRSRVPLSPPMIVKILVDAGLVERRKNTTRIVRTALTRNRGSFELVDRSRYRSNAQR